ncbi:hypothetical protein DM02DRAFT_35006 [Periconia macrospinosa]|uniref:Uncharacterized protein n=1 Tax=Periconia macrospinosa TaxID=97972 RepID=A0A2V1E7R8_9PLEO|nr:hypothetical protein DM02DRAFT_35006 [Periconia macrospinosa]
MSKRDNAGEIISNKLAVAAAQQHQALFASLAGATGASIFSAPTTTEDNDDDLRDTYVDDEQFGVGAAIPKDIEDGSFTRRIPASDDKLLQQLLGKKAAKAHLARQTTKNAAKPQGNAKPQRSVAKKEESEEEEEGRASAFKSKRRKVVKGRGVNSAVEDSSDDGRRGAADANETESAALALRQGPQAKEKVVDKTAGPDGLSEDEERPKSTSKSRATKAKPGSYLDELLAGRANKKQKKKK